MKKLTKKQKEQKTFSLLRRKFQNEKALNVIRAENREINNQLKKLTK